MTMLERAVMAIALREFKIKYVDNKEKLPDDLQKVIDLIQAFKSM